MSLIDQSELISLYKDGKSLTDLSNSTGMTICSIYKVLKEGEVLRSRKEGLLLKKEQISKSRMKFNEDVFDTIGITESYFLGLLYSDGCVCETTKNRHTISFSSKDWDLIGNVKSFFVSKNKIYISEGKYYHISFCSTKVFNRLIELGCIPNKSHCIEPPRINYELIPSFLMGVFDGDGSLSCNKSINSWKASIGTASYSLFDWICSYIGQHNFSYSYEMKTTKNGPFFVITMCGFTAFCFLEILYSSVSGSETLDRKRLLYEGLKTMKFKRGPSFLDWEKDILEDKSLSDKECVMAINSSDKNYGWKRSYDTIRYSRRMLK